MRSPTGGRSQDISPDAKAATADAFCRRMLPRVSRTFALNIPVLPKPLDIVVTVAYLLCRIADTIEDESSAPDAERSAQLAELTRVADLGSNWQHASRALAARIAGSLRERAPEAQRDLCLGLPQVLTCYAEQPKWSHSHVAKCIRAMTAGMAELTAQNGTPQGLANLDETLLYCHYVAGTVGEMLTALFIGYSPECAAHREFLEANAGSFGRALQLTNILQDVYDDMERGSCWLPRTALSRHGLTPQQLVDPAHRDKALALLDDLIAVAHREARAAFEYTLRIPKSEPGIRTFCLWPLFNAVLTLKALQGNSDAFGPTRVKIKRSMVKLVMSVTRGLVSSDRALRLTFKGATRGLSREVSPALD